MDGNPIDFEATGWFARIMQHEYDHLDGYLYVNRLNGKWTRRWKKALRREGWTVPGTTWMPGEDEDPFGHDEVDPAEIAGSGEDTATEAPAAETDRG